VDAAFVLGMLGLGLVLGFGAWGLARAASISETVRATFLCF
jgi:hypothetical protein